MGTPCDSFKPGCSCSTVGSFLYPLPHRPSSTITQGTRNSKTSSLEVAGLQKWPNGWRVYLPALFPTPWEQFQTLHFFILIPLQNKNQRCLDADSLSQPFRGSPHPSILTTLLLWVLLHSGLVCLAVIRSSCRFLCLGPGIGTRIFLSSPGDFNVQPNLGTVDTGTGLFRFIGTSPGAWVKMHRLFRFSKCIDYLDDLDSVSLSRAWDSAFLPSSQVQLLLLVPGASFK